MLGKSWKSVEDRREGAQRTSGGVLDVPGWLFRSTSICSQSLHALRAPRALSAPTHLGENEHGKAVALVLKVCRLVDEK